MGVVVAAMIVTALWIVLGAVLHGGRELARDTGGEAWWWESSDRLARHPGLPPSHPVARLGRSSSDSIG